MFLAAKGMLLSSLQSVHQTLISKDQYQFFLLPVTDDIAPGYSAMIKQPMDFRYVQARQPCGTPYMESFMSFSTNVQHHGQED
jgi:hypothetical protein